jgi:cell shape-determining protein MreC
MDYNELLTKYHALQSENHRLREENKRLRLQLGIPEQPGIPF